MRYLKTHKQESRRTIVRAAAREFSRHGVDGIGIAGIMKSAGLTPGAFSGHFSSKAELVREAMDEAFQMSHFVLPAWAGKSLDDLVRTYLSREHRDLPGIGCPAGAFAPDIARQPRRTRQLFQSHVADILKSIESRLPREKSAKDKKRTAIAIFATMVGSLQLARVTKGAGISDEILESGIQSAALLAEMKS